MNEIHSLLLCTALTFIMLLVASLMRSRGWTPSGMKVAFGNRDDVPEPSPMAARADRAAKNMLENMTLFCAALLAAHLANGNATRIALGAQIFFWARLLYFFTYVAGIAYVRTLLWAVALGGVAVIASTAL
jgi:uncharacterized MAPEG superfamily protein